MTLIGMKQYIKTTIKNIQFFHRSAIFYLIYDSKQFDINLEQCKQIKMLYNSYKVLGSQQTLNLNLKKKEKFSPPPCILHWKGNLQMFPIPTALPTSASKYSALFDQFSLSRDFPCFEELLFFSELMSFRDVFSLSRDVVVQLLAG